MEWRLIALFDSEYPKSGYSPLTLLGDFRLDLFVGNASRSNLECGEE
jgi:hypothetical protein